MTSRRTTWAVTIRLALVLSVVAATMATILAAVGVDAEPVIVLAVIVVGFTTSWVRTGHTAPTGVSTGVHDAHAAHRVVTVPMRHLAR